MLLEERNCILITALDIEQRENIKAFESFFLGMNSKPSYIKQNDSHHSPKKTIWSKKI